MRNYLKNILLFLSPIVVLAYPIDLWISSSLKKEDHIDFANGELNTWNYIYCDTTKSELLIYGSSRAWVHIDPNVIQKELGVTAFNYGIDGHNFVLQNLRHRESVKEKGYPKYVIYSIDVFTLAKRPDLFNSEQFLPYMFMNGSLQQTLLTYEGFRKADFFIPLSRYFGKKKALDALFQENPSEKRELGYLGFDLQWNNDLKNAQKDKGTVQIELDSSSISEFKALIKELKMNNVQICLIYTPEYIEAQNFVSNRGDILNLFRNISNENELLFLDYSDHLISKSKKYFYNGSHMNRTGAELFTKTVTADLLTKKWID